MSRTPSVAAIVLAACALLASAPSSSRAQSAAGPALLADRIDVSGDFRDFANNYYVADKVIAFDPVTATGTLKWVRNNRYPRLAFNYIEGCCGRSKG